MNPDYISRMYGAARLDPQDAVVAGSYGTWRLTYTVGEYAFDDGGTLKIAWRFATDWGFPQTGDPTAPDYLTVATTGPASLSARFDTKGGVRPWRKCLLIDVFDDGLHPGDEIIVTYGDTSGGSPGARAQTFCEHTFEFRVLVNPIATGEFTRLPTSPEIEIISGPAAKLACITPSDATIGEDIELLVKAEDAWGNPAREYSGTVSFRHTDGLLEGLPDEYRFTPADRGVRRFAARAVGSGPARVTVADAKLDLAAISNPTFISSEGRALRRYWGDLHGQTEATVGTNTVGDYFAFARDDAALDFCCHQGNDFQVTKDDWRETQEEVRTFNEPARFVAFLGYEWSGNTGVGGDHNVIYLRDDEAIYRSSHALIRDISDTYLDRNTIENLYAEMRNHDALVIPHVGGRRADLSRLDPEVVKLVEVYSAWGRFEWMLETALLAGHKVGVVANSDGHKCRPGASYPGASTFGVYGGLTCALASELTREAIFEALQSRRCYATTGERILLDVTCADSTMGEQLELSGPPSIDVGAWGTRGIESIELLRCIQGDNPRIEIIHTHRPPGPPSNSRLRVAWGGARIYGRNRSTIWQGSLTVEGARITRCIPWALDNPTERVEQVGPGQIAFDTMTTGHQDGVILELDNPTEAVLHFQSAPCSFELPVGDIGDDAVRFDAGGVRQHVEVTRLPQQSPPQEMQFRFTDDDAPEGDLAYWVRLRQDDGAMAWSSPIFIRRASL